MIHTVHCTVCCHLLTTTLTYVCVGDNNSNDDDLMIIDDLNLNSFRCDKIISMLIDIILL